MNTDGHRDVITLDESVAVIDRLCRRFGRGNLITEWQVGRAAAGLTEAVRTNDVKALYRWLIDCFSYYGISDRAAAAYIDRHGNATWDEVEGLLANHDSDCPKLHDFLSYVGCGYRRGRETCNRPDDLADRPVPKLPLRKGDLNQTAFSLYFFLRDRCDRDLVGLIDQILAKAGDPQAWSIDQVRQALIKEFSSIHGVSEKLARLALAGLLIGTDPERPDWVNIGSSIIVVDTLVHNFLHRTGIAPFYGLDHRYGSRCYGPNGCEAIITDLAHRFDARTLHPDYPKTFPRLVQLGIWNFCAERRDNICNGRQIDDSKPCLKIDCPVGDLCRRIPLRPEGRE